jgi:hypothetical protein
MPWKPADATKHCKTAKSDKQKRGWSEAANSARKKALAEGKSEAEADAIGVKVGNAAVANIKEEDATSGRLQEIAPGPAAPIRVDKEQGILHDVLFLGLHSRNRADYSGPVMEAALSQYEGAQSYTGHSRDGSNPDFDRSFGVPRNCHVAADGIRGDYHFPPKHRLAEQLIWAAENNPRAVGFSHDADCTWRMEKGRRIVTSIDRVYSVDLVTRPGTTRGLFEEDEPITEPIQEEDHMGVEYKDLTVETLTQERPDLVAVLQGTDEHSRLTEELTTSKAAVTAKDTEIAALKAERDALKATEARRLKEEEIAAELKAANFPVADEVVYSARFQEQLKAAPDKAARAEIMQDRLAVAGRIQEGITPPPLADLRPAQKNAKANPAFDSMFGKAA